MSKDIFIWLQAKCKLRLMYRAFSWPSASGNYSLEQAVKAKKGPCLYCCLVLLGLALPQRMGSQICPCIWSTILVWVGSKQDILHVVVRQAMLLRANTGSPDSQSPACRTVRTAALLSQAILTKGFQVSSQAQTWLFAEINIGTWNAELT